MEGVVVVCSVGVVLADHFLKRRAALRAERDRRASRRPLVSGGGRGIRGGILAATKPIPPRGGVVVVVVWSHVGLLKLEAGDLQG